MIFTFKIIYMADVKIWPIFWIFDQEFEAPVEFLPDIYRHKNPDYDNFIYSCYFLISSGGYIEVLEKYELSWNS